MEKKPTSVEMAVEDLALIEHLLTQATKETTIRALERSADLIRREIKQAAGTILL